MSLNHDSANVARFFELTNSFCNYNHKHLNKRAEEVNDGFIRYVSSLKPNKALFYDGQISRAEKEESILKYERRSKGLKEQIDALLRLIKEMKVEDKLNYSINIIENLGEFFKSAQPEIKVLLLGSIFLGKIEFDGKNYRTNSYNRMLDVIYQETNRLQGHKNKKSPENSGDFSSVPGAGTIP